MESEESYLKLSVALILLVWNWLVSTHLETPYPSDLVEAYALPLTRLFLLGLVILSAVWSPSVGLMAALAYASLGADVIFFTNLGKSSKPSKPSKSSKPANDS